MNLRMTPRTARRVGWLACYIVVFVSAFLPSGMRQSVLELDPSWHAVMEYAAAHHWQFGTQIVFTFGPLGFLSTRTSLGHLIAARVTFAFFWSAVVALAAVGVAKRLPGWVRYAFLAWLVVFTVSEGIDQTAFFVMAYGTVLLLSDAPRERWQAPVFVCAAVILSLIKITFLIAGLASLLVVLTCWICQRKIVPALVLALAAPLGFIACWMALGQAPSHLIPWFEHAWQLSAGYSAAMNLVPKTPVLAAAVAALVCFVGAFVATATGSHGAIPDQAILVTIAQYVFFAWKEGFTRSGDWHVFVFFWFLPLGIAFLFRQDISSPAESLRQMVPGIALAAATVCCLAGANFQISGFAWRQAAEWPRRFFRDSGMIFAAARGRAADLYAGCHDSKASQMMTLDRAKDVIGNESVDVLNYLALAPIINGMNYRPRPVFQGFVAYTPALQNLNEQYFRSADRPHFILLSQEATDGRFPTLEDSAALNYVLNNYVPVARDGPFLVLQQRTKVNPVFQLVHEQTLHFGETLDLRSWAGAPLFMSVSIRPTLLGRAVALVYQQEPLVMRVARGGPWEDYRVVPSMAVQPFLVNPVLNANHDLLSFYASIHSLRTNSVVFARPHHGSFEFQGDVTVKLYTSPGFPNAVKGISSYDILADVQGRVFASRPQFVQNPCGTQVVIFHGSPAWLMCAPSKIVLDVPANATSFSGSFGVPGRIYPGDQTVRERVNITIDACENAVVCRRVFDQSLVPPSGGGEGDKFTFRIPIDSSRGHFIHLSTAPGASAASPESLAAWSQCRFEKTSAP